MSHPKQTTNQCICLRIAQTGLRDYRSAGLCIDIGQIQHINIPLQSQILFDLCRMNIVQLHLLFCLIADFQQFPQAICNSCKVDAVKDVRGIFTIPPQITGGNTRVVGLKVLRQHIQGETVVNVLYHTIDGAG